MVSWHHHREKLGKACLIIFGLLSMLILLHASSVLASTTSGRLMGNDRYLTAIAISQKSYPNGTDTAILTTGENFPDALSAAPLAQKYNAPILLTEFNNLNSDTSTELKRLKVKKVYIIGGTGVISDDIDKQLYLMGISALRLAGQDRYETALLVANEVGIKSGIFVVSGLDFPDALSVAPIAAAKGMPIILVPSDDLTSLQKSFLSKNTIPNTYILNDNSEISDNIIKQFPVSEVIYGSNPYERNINLLNRFIDDLDLSTVYLATGKNFPDALAASALARKKNNAIILLDGDSIPPQVSTFLATKVVGTINVLGGYAVITPHTETELKALPAQIESIADITPTIQEKQPYVLPKTVTATLTNGLTSEVWVTWSLSSVATAQTGTYYYKGKVNGYDSLVNLTLTITPSSNTNDIKVDNISAEIVLGGSYTLPRTVDVKMSDNSIQTLPVTWSTNITMPNKVGTYTYQGSIEGISQKITLTLKVSSDLKVTFKDTNLENLIRSQCGKYDQTKTLFKSDIISIEYLDANGNNIQDLNGIESLTNLKFLNLGSNNALTSAKLAPLGKLTNLKSLLLNSLDKVSDVSALKSLSKLEALDLRYDAIKDFSPLKTLTKLKQLYIKYNVSTDYYPLTPIYNNLTAKDFDLD